MSEGEGYSESETVEFMLADRVQKSGVAASCSVTPPTNFTPQSAGMGILQRGYPARHSMTIY
ncbi:hypothetical protein [Pseudomonas sp. MH10]|uniref:hypothetical protein n=1 Tax=Pseudomonas sp. MH10 TaxID=3048627 RepID=UPI002B23914A|nr:hypothetical protein [Pseudomonas sp. MH10]MEB0043714.1 hypothetical protein [Pseudomonas sp. MH10]